MITTPMYFFQFPNLGSILSVCPSVRLSIFFFFEAAHIKRVSVHSQQSPPCWDFVTDSSETSKAKVTVEMSHSSVKMRVATQLPAISPDDDLTGILLQVGLSTEMHKFPCKTFCYFTA